MVRIRLQRLGQPKKPFYRIVVIDSRKRRNGSPIEMIGHYDPFNEDNRIVINKERLNYWLKCGAQPSDTVRSLIPKSGLS